MTRALYRVFLALHPPAFRRQYATEMLWIFDLTAAESGVFSLMRDVLISLLRQWFLRSHLWRVPVAMAGALFTLLSGNALMHFLFRGIIVGHADSPRELFIFVTALALPTVAVTLVAAVLPVLRARRRRA